jgi:hypothetical protein
MSENSDRAKKLRKAVADRQDRPLGGKSYSMGLTYPANVGSARKSAEAAYDHTQNMKESEAEDLEERDRRAKNSRPPMSKKW